MGEVTYLNFPLDPVSDDEDDEVVQLQERISNAQPAAATVVPATATAVAATAATTIWNLWEMQRTQNLAISEVRELKKMFHYYSGELADPLPSDFVSFLISSCPFSDVEKQMLQLELVLDCLWHTYPYFYRRDSAKIDALERNLNQALWQIYTGTERNFADQVSKKLTKVETLIHDKILQMQTSQSCSSCTSGRLNTLPTAKDETDYFYWILVSLIDLYGTKTQRQAIFRALNFNAHSLDNVDQVRDIELMIGYLSQFNLFKLERELTSIYYFSEHGRLCSGHGGLDKVLLVVPCQSFVKVFAKQLPWEYLLKFGDQKWRELGEHHFVPQIRELTNLITPIANSVLDYLWGEKLKPTLSVESREPVKSAESNLQTLPSSSYFKSECKCKRKVEEVEVYDNSKYQEFDLDKLESFAEWKTNQPTNSTTSTALAASIEELEELNIYKYRKNACRVDYAHRTPNVKNNQQFEVDKPSRHQQKQQKQRRSSHLRKYDHSRGCRGGR